MVVRVLAGSVLAFVVGVAVDGTLLGPFGNATIALPYLALGAVAWWQLRARDAGASRQPV